MKILGVVAAFLCLSLTAVMDAHALWYFRGTQVSVGDYSQMTASSAAPDGAGGTVVVWATDQHVYAKRYDSTGAVVSGWSLVTVGDVEDTPAGAPQIVFNGTYWYVAWVDPHMVAGGGSPVPGYIVRVAKLKSAGVVFHSAYIFDSGTSDARYLTMATRSGGGVALAWEDQGDGHVQYLRGDLAAGASTQWSGVSSVYSNPVQVVTGSNNGTIVAYSNGMIQADGADSTISSGWGNPMLYTSGSVTDFAAISDGAGGAVISADVSYAGTYRIWLQHVNSSGATQWDQGGGVIGQPLCISSCSNVGGSRLVLDSAGTDAILTWFAGSDVHAQKLPLSSFSRTTWGGTSNGTLVTSDCTGNDVPTPVANANGYTTVVWSTSYASTYFGVHYQILEDDGDLAMGGDGSVTDDQPSLNIGSPVAGASLNSFAVWWIYDGADLDLRASRLVPICSVETEYNVDRCQNNVSWGTPSSGTTNRLDYRHIGGSGWTTKTAGGTGSHTAFYPQYVPSEFKLRTTISSVEYESLVYQDGNGCDEPDPQGVSMAPTNVKDAYLNAQPNPFNPIVTIGYGVPGTLPVDLAIYDVSGRRVKTLYSGVRNNGAYKAMWKGEDDRGGHVASGVYFSRLSVGNKLLTQKLVMLK